MNRKKRFLISLLILSFITAAITYYLFEVPLPNQPPAQITMVSLPSPPMAKVITDPETIKALFERLENQTYTPDLRSTLAAPKGWQLRILYQGGELTFLGDLVTIKGRHFVVEKNLLQELVDFYQAYPAEETPWLP